MNVDKSDLPQFIKNLEAAIPMMEKYKDVINYGNQPDLAIAAIVSAHLGITEGYPIELVEYAPKHRSYMEAL